jgi:hypothetical protein
MEHNIWNLLGKYHSHYLFIRDIFFDSAASDHETSRLFSLGEDQEIIEYDLPHRSIGTFDYVVFRNCKGSSLANKAFLRVRMYMHFVI